MQIENKEKTFTPSGQIIYIYTLKFLKSFFLNGPSPASFIVYFRSFQTNITILQQYMWKNVHPVSSTGIRTHDLLKLSLLP